MYVDPYFGSDANDGSLEHPFCTIDHALAVYSDSKKEEWIIVLGEPTKEGLLHGRKIDNVNIEKQICP